MKRKIRLLIPALVLVGALAGCRTASAPSVAPTDSAKPSTIPSATASPAPSAVTSDSPRTRGWEGAPGDVTRGVGDAIGDAARDVGDAAGDLVRGAERGVRDMMDDTHSWSGARDQARHW